ncbi:SLATT domain-containing protein [Streptomyces sp. NPDC058613]|uniref:SLATT domain-containing protein n=1 Tax=Streptomyces sp. NPDC058613 TaxID=3346556 RepID=UPI003669D530
MTVSSHTQSGTLTTDVLIEHRREIADLQQRIRNRRLQVAGLYGTPSAVVAIVVAWAGLKISLWTDSPTPKGVGNTLVGILFLLVVATAAQFAIEFSSSFDLWRDEKTSVRKLKLDLALAEERHILEARRHTPPPADRQASYRERLPGEVFRLRAESRHYRRMHLLMQWLLFFGSASISAVAAWFDPPQPGKGVLIALGFMVTVVTAAAGYFKPRERAFNLQQTADSIEQHATALDLGIAPYNSIEEAKNLEVFATTVEGLRAEQRMREQQLDQPQQGQQQVI